MARATVRKPAKPLVKAVRKQAVRGAKLAKPKAQSRSVTGGKMPAKSQAKNLVQSWLDVEMKVHQKSVGEAIRDLNAHLGSAHTHSRVSEWRMHRNGRGGRLPREIRLYMARVVMKYVLEGAKLDVRALNKRRIQDLAEQLC